MSIEYAGLPMEAILRITYPDYAEHLRKTKAHNNRQQKSERNIRHIIEKKIMRKKDKSIVHHGKVNSTLRLSLVDGSIEQGLFRTKHNNTIGVPMLDPFIGSTMRKERRLSLMDGMVEEVNLIVLPPIKGKEKSK